MNPNTCTDKFIARANDIYKFNLPLPIIIYDLKGQDAGKAFGNLWEIHYNIYKYQENPFNFLNIVVPHEVAHLVEYKLYNKMSHGKTWKDIMKSFGIKKPMANYKIDVWTHEELEAAKIQAVKWQNMLNCTTSLSIK